MPGFCCVSRLGFAPESRPRSGFGTRFQIAPERGPADPSTRRLFFDDPKTRQHVNNQSVCCTTLNTHPLNRITPIRLLGQGAGIWGASHGLQASRTAGTVDTQVHAYGESQQEQGFIDQVFASFLDIAAQTESGTQPPTGAYSTVLRKLVSSTAHTAGQVRVQSELSFEDNCEPTLAQLKRMVDWQASLGINRFVTRPFSRGAGPPAEIGLYQPGHWPHYRSFRRLRRAAVLCALSGQAQRPGCRPVPNQRGKGRARTHFRPA